MPKNKPKYRKGKSNRPKYIENAAELEKNQEYFKGQRLERIARRKEAGAMDSDEEDEEDEESEGEGFDEDAYRAMREGRGNNNASSSTSEMSAAEQAAAQALAEYEASLSQAREQAQQTIADARAEGQRLFDEMKAKNERELAERISRANADIEAARKAAIIDLHANATELATAVASRILQREINPSDQAKLVEESLKELDVAKV